MVLVSSGCRSLLLALLLLVQGDVLGHTAFINAQEYTAIDDKLIPTGDLVSVKGTPFDFYSKAKAFGQDIQQILPGYDHNFALEGGATLEPRLACDVSSSSSGIGMRVCTDAPGLQLYTASCLGRTKGKKGAIYGQHHAFCVECQSFPDAMNKPNFPTAIVKVSSPSCVSSFARYVWHAQTSRLAGWRQV
eukprot:scaffold236_cov419-Prasinococcus_capsulatus_cf.AAC.21